MRECVRYSMAFKQKVVQEIEERQISIYKAQKIYDIKGSRTIQQWIRRFGKKDLLPRMVRIEMKDEQDKVKRLEKRIRELESALADEHLNKICLESLIEVAEKHYGVDFKKNFGQNQQD